MEYADDTHIHFTSLTVPAGSSLDLLARYTPELDKWSTAERDEFRGCIRGGEKESLSHCTKAKCRATTAV